jgi:hypothetical protein
MESRLGDEERVKSRLLSIYSPSAPPDAQTFVSRTRVSAKPGHTTVRANEDRASKPVSIGLLLDTSQFVHAACPIVMIRSSHMKTPGAHLAVPARYDPSDTVTIVGLLSRGTLLVGLDN